MKNVLILLSVCLPAYVGYADFSVRKLESDSIPFTTDFSFLTTTAPCIPTTTVVSNSSNQLVRLSTISKLICSVNQSADPKTRLSKYFLMTSKCVECRSSKLHLQIYVEHISWTCDGTVVSNKLCLSGRQRFFMFVMNFLCKMLILEEKLRNDMGVWQCAAYLAGNGTAATWTLRTSLPEYIIAMTTIIGSIFFVVGNSYQSSFSSYISYCMPETKFRVNFLLLPASHFNEVEYFQW